MKYLLTAALLLSTTAFAGGGHNQQPVMESNSDATAIAVSKSNASSKSISGAVALGGNSKAIAGDSTATNNLDNFGNSSVSNVNNVGVDLAGAVTVGGPTIEGDTLSTGDISNIVEGSTWNAGSQSMTGPTINQGDVTMTNMDRIQHNLPQLGRECIGSTCVAVSAWGLSGSYDQETGQSVNFSIVGVAPWDRAKGSKSALRYEVRKLELSTIHAETREVRAVTMHMQTLRINDERHETEINILCHKLHVAGQLAGEGICKGKMYTDVNHSETVGDISLDVDRSPGH